MMIILMIYIDDNVDYSKLSHYGYYSRKKKNILIQCIEKKNI